MYIKDSSNLNLRNIFMEVFNLNPEKDFSRFLVFIPNAFTPVCSSEIIDLVQFVLPKYDSTKFDICVISCDSVFTLKAWSESLPEEVKEAISSNRLKLLSDFWPHGNVSKFFNTFDLENGNSFRKTFFINENQIKESFGSEVFKPRLISSYTDICNKYLL